MRRSIPLENDKGHISLSNVLPPLAQQFHEIFQYHLMMIYLLSFFINGGQKSLYHTTVENEKSKIVYKHVRLDFLLYDFSKKKTE